MTTTRINYGSTSTTNAATGDPNLSINNNMWAPTQPPSTTINAGYHVYPPNIAPPNIAPIGGNVATWNIDVIELMEKIAILSKDVEEIKETLVVITGQMYEVVGELLDLLKDGK